MRQLANDDPLAVAAVAAIRTGDLAMLKQLLADNPDLAIARVADPCRAIGGDHSRTLLHTATDWPGHFPNGVETVETLIAAGAEVNARCAGPHGETPLHWAASSDDVGVLDRLLDRGADIEADGAVIGGGTPVADAVAFGQWNAARRLVKRGAKTNLWQSAAMGLIERGSPTFQRRPRSIVRGSQQRPVVRLPRRPARSGRIHARPRRPPQLDRPRPPDAARRRPPQRRQRTGRLAGVARGKIGDGIEVADVGGFRP